MDISVNKPAKDYLKGRFDEWYSSEVMKQLNGRDMDKMKEANIQPIDLALPVWKKLGAEWLVRRFEYISDNPQFIFNGFLRSGITSAFVGEAAPNTSNSRVDTSDSSEKEC